MYKIELKESVFDIKNLHIANCKDDLINHIKDYFEKYKEYLKTKKVSKEIVDQVKEFAGNINICLLEYYVGQHDSAMYYFKKAMCCINYKEIVHSLREVNFFRARKKENGVFTKQEMFHIPFEKRYLVSTQRYSYPGLPCLYLGSSVDMCCEELNCWDDNLNIAIIERNQKKEIFILDLFFFDAYDFENLSIFEFERFVRFWPLVACCSFVYIDSEKMKFRPDYIIPQLLLEYIIDKKAENNLRGINMEINGIRYHSVKTNFLQEYNTAQYIYANYVFPSQSIAKIGVCNILEQIFNVKQVLLLNQISKND